jgi:hypothetical protein
MNGGEGAPRAPSNRGKSLESWCVENTVLLWWQDRQALGQLTPWGQVTLCPEAASDEALSSVQVWLDSPSDDDVSDDDVSDVLTHDVSDDDGGGGAYADASDDYVLEVDDDDVFVACLYGSDDDVFGAHMERTLECLVTELYDYEVW